MHVGLPVKCSLNYVLVRDGDRCRTRKRIAVGESASSDRRFSGYWSAALRNGGGKAFTLVGTCVADAPPSAGRPRNAPRVRVRTVLAVTG
jgi:hypothetical protein